jgi:hypothetical protein
MQPTGPDCGTTLNGGPQSTSGDPIANYSRFVQGLRVISAVILLGCMFGAYAALAPKTVMIIMAIQQTLANVFLQATVGAAPTTRECASPSAELQASPAGA